MVRFLSHCAGPETNHTAAMYTEQEESESEREREAEGERKRERERVKKEGEAGWGGM